MTLQQETLEFKESVVHHAKAGEEREPERTGDGGKARIGGVECHCTDNCMCLMWTPAEKTPLILFRSTLGTLSVD